MSSFKKILGIFFCCFVAFALVCCQNAAESIGSQSSVSESKESSFSQNNGSVLEESSSADVESDKSSSDNDNTSKIYTITYDTALAHGVSITAKTQQVIFGERVVLYVPTHSDYEFLGWFTNEGVLFEDGIYNFNTDITLTARWKEKENGGFGFS